MSLLVKPDCAPEEEIIVSYYAPEKKMSTFWLERIAQINRRLTEASRINARPRVEEDIRPQG